MPASPLRRLVGRILWVLRPRLGSGFARRRAVKVAARRQTQAFWLDDATAQMQHLLGPVGRGDEVEAQAREYIAFAALQGELRWSPRAVTRQRVEGAEHLTAAHATGRGALVTFAHHGHFDGLVTSVAEAAGVPAVVAAAPSVVDSPSPRMMQHSRVVGYGRKIAVFAATEGTAGMTRRMADGQVVFVACDVPGSSVVQFGGRPVKSSSGAIRAAQTAGVPLLVVTSERDPDGVPFLRVSEARDTTAAPVQEILQSVVSTLEPSVYAWPFATFLPLSCWSPASADADAPAS
ncbi:hypothetical protein [Aeromicrobium sp. Leaf350]|uniref:hypothetical protein n=1 Tax=Aeromicrobium sp. Leaf350 TaxID=2876565 RepID=UPI001E62D3BC|nr:hypothetical protein [Aeromicrobium sp. Leaf350]